jgi:hypothetical protein
MKIVISMPSVTVPQLTFTTGPWSWPSTNTLFPCGLTVPDAADEFEEELVLEFLLEQPANAATTIAAPATPTTNRSITSVP